MKYSFIEYCYNWLAIPDSFHETVKFVYANRTNLEPLFRLKRLCLFGISSTFLSSFLFPKKVCKSFSSRCVFCNVALFSCSAIKLSIELVSTNLSDILKIKRRLPNFHANNDVACRTITFD